jgi:hypothetical protein
LTGTAGAAGGVLGGSYPNPAFAVDMATQAELDAVSSVVSVLSTAVTYYVDPVSGSDAATGTSTAAPWQTIAKLNATTFHAGDRILLKRGTTISGAMWSFLGAGTPAAPITIGCYGTGALPIMDGQNLRLNLYIDGANGCANVIVQNIDFRGANDGGSLQLRRMTTPFAVQACNFTGNAFNGSGGALLVRDCSGRLDAVPGARQLQLRRDRQRPLRCRSVRREQRRAERPLLLRLLDPRQPDRHDQSRHQHEGVYHL